MEKRYQVFVSSTFNDLKYEREEILQTLLKMRCIPAGMEFFPAIDQNQFEYIKSVISQSDYYLLVIGGRYGSLATDGISYTEKEYDYAVTLKKRVIALVHGDLNSIPFGKSESSPKIRLKLEEFRKKVVSGRLVKFWSSPSELITSMQSSLYETFQNYPETGWIRGDTKASPEILIELNEIRKENKKLLIELEKIKKNENIEIEDLADLESEFIINFKRIPDRVNKSQIGQLRCSWKELFLSLAPKFKLQPSNDFIHVIIEDALKLKSMEQFKISISSDTLETILAQFQLYGLIKYITPKTKTNSNSPYWELTEKGNQVILISLAVRRS